MHVRRPKSLHGKQETTAGVKVKTGVPGETEASSLLLWFCWIPRGLQSSLRQPFYALLMLSGWRWPLSLQFSRCSQLTIMYGMAPVAVFG